MDKDLLLQNMFQAVENTKAMRDSIDKSFDEFAKKNLAEQRKKNLVKQRRFTISCKAKDLNKELARLKPVLSKILS